MKKGGEEKKTAGVKKETGANKEGGKKKGGKPAVEEEKLEEVWEVFSKCDLRVGRVVECEPHP